MTLSRIGRISMALLVSVAMGLGMTSCGGGTIGFMWVLGTQYNQIGAFKIDDFTGKLTGAVGSPFPSGGTKPVMLALNGRYLYVLNAGDATGATGNFSLFSVGGGARLNYQQSYTTQGSFPVWITTDPTGSFLFVLDQRSPNYGNPIDPTQPLSATNPVDLNGSIAAYALDPNTGVPTLITNTSAVGTPLSYFEVGNAPTEMRNTAGCLYTLDSGDQTIFPYSIASTGGQLAAGSSFGLGTQQATSVNIGGSYVYVTDAGSTVGGAGSILAFSQGSNCALTAVSGGATANLPTASFPIQTVTSSSSSGTFLYVLNHSTVNTNYSNSSVSAFTVQSNGQLGQITDTNNPYSVGSGPVCLAIDPTNQYLYTSDQIASTVTGKRISNQYGYLSDLTKGSSFATVGTPSCLVVSNDVGN